MSLFEILTIVISAVALGFSLYAIHLSRVGAHLTWERDNIRPYYQDVTEFLELVKRAFFSKDLNVNLKPDAKELILRAANLGLTDCQISLEQMMIRINELDAVSFYDSQTDVENAEIWMESLRRKIQMLEDDIHREIERLTKRPALARSRYRT